MFQKPTFGSNASSGFGSFNAGASTSFGGFKSTNTTSAFGAPPAFGATASTQPATGGGLFGSSTTSGGLFGGAPASTAAPAFGGTSGGFGFGGGATTGGGLFTGGTTGGGGLFGGGAQNTSAFGAKPAGFGFGGTSTAGTTGGLFGAPAATGSGLFGQQQPAAAMPAAGSLFANTQGAFGQQPAASGTAHAKYNPVVGTDVVVKSGNSQNINIKHHCITCMKEYESKSLEELRLEDYLAGRKGSAAAGGVFGGFQQPADNKPLFGNTSFGQPATTSAPGVFGGGGFGQPSTFSFGGNTQTQANTSSLFGAAKPAFGATTNTTGSSLFGATTTQAPTFGTNTSTFGFGASTQNQTGGGLFGAKPTTGAFGATPATGTSGFGSFGTSGGGLFAAKTQQTTAPTFGAAQPAFGGFSSGFGATTSTAGSLGGAFGKPATQQGFGFGATPTNTLGGLGSGLGASSFQSKPAAPAFGTLGGGSLFQQNAPATTFKTGLEGGAGGGMFGGAGSLGSSLGGFGANNTTLSLGGTSMGGAAGASAGGNVHEQILTLAARPYGDSPLFRDLLPNSSSAEDMLKPTNPAAVKAVLDNSAARAYRVGSPPVSGGRLRVQPRQLPLAHDKKSLFEGLEEGDTSLEDKLCLKPSRKRLVLRVGGATGPPPVDRRADESASQHEVTGLSEREREAAPDGGESQREPRQAERPDTNGLDNSSERNGSWLSASKAPWGDKEKSIDDVTPRLYPNLDKDGPPISDRRASWLTTKPLRKVLVSNPELAENSVRELGVRSPPPAAEPPAPGALDADDKENIDELSVPEEERPPPAPPAPHPAGVRLTRPGYYTIPSLEEMINYMRPDGSCVVPHLTIGRKNYGNVFYDCEIDVAGLDLDALVHFLNKEVIVYPEDGDKPPVGEGLNRRAIVTLDRVWPRDKSERRPITDPDRLLKMDYEGKLRRVCDKHDTKFIEYRPLTGSWVFRVEHFSKYGLTDSDEEEEAPPDVLRRQLATQALQGSAAPGAQLAAVTKQAVPVPAPGLAGLGGLGGLGSASALSGASAGLPAGAEDSLLAMHHSSLALLNSAGKGFAEMDTTEDNADAQSLYQDTTRAFGMKSPTSELARLEHRRSHHVQLMKASLYADHEMEEDVCSSVGDQLVPQPSRAPTRSDSPAPSDVRRAARPDHAEDAPPPTHLGEELPMRPLHIQPETIVLKYHRKVPPFKQTIAGRLDAACIADMSVCRARHSRVGFGPAGALVYTTSYDAVADLPAKADLCEMGRYVSGRAPDDWSERLVVRLGVGRLRAGGDADDDGDDDDPLSRHLDALLEYSSSEPGPDPESDDANAPRLRVRSEPSARLALLRAHIDIATDAEQRHTAETFGVSATYCREVWQLCAALWGADLENDGVRGTDVQSRVERHARLLRWLAGAVADVTEQELRRPASPEPEDDKDGHSARVWTLLLAGRVLEACRVARDHGDLNMAVLLAQAAGDRAYRSLISRQLSVWRECGALELVSARRRAALQLLAGACCPRDLLLDTDWLRALHATARYLCPAVPSLERVVRTYESFFADERGGEGGDEEAEGGEVDLAAAAARGDGNGMRPPLPPFADEYDVHVYKAGERRLVLDLRYELVAACARDARPRLRPQAYTPDPLDYSLCFLVGAWLGLESAESVCGVAAQLEARGAWHRAVQALCYHPDDRARAHLIRGVVSRHAPAQAVTGAQRRRLALVRRLAVPPRWLLLAQAHRAKYEVKPAGGGGGAPGGRGAVERGASRAARAAAARGRAAQRRGPRGAAGGAAGGGGAPARGQRLGGRRASAAALPACVRRDPRAGVGRGGGRRRGRGRASGRRSRRAAGARGGAAPAPRRRLPCARHAAHGDGAAALRARRDGRATRAAVRGGGVRAAPARRAAARSTAAARLRLPRSAQDNSGPGGRSVGIVHRNVAQLAALLAPAGCRTELERDGYSTYSKLNCGNYGLPRLVGMVLKLHVKDQYEITPGP